MSFFIETTSLVILPICSNGRNNMIQGIFPIPIFIIEVAFSMTRKYTEIKLAFLHFAPKSRRI